MPSQPILVIGATGTVGREVVAQLLAGGHPVRALVRNPDAAVLPPQVELAAGDLTHPETLDRCLDSVDTAFLVWVAPPSAAAPAIERIARSVRRMVFLSAPIKTPHPFFQQPNAARDLTAQLEHLIESSGMEWTFLRPHIFAANALDWWLPQIRANNAVRWPYLDVATAPIDERDIAAVAVRALCEPGHASADYVISGPESITQYEQIATIGRVLDRQVRIEEISPEEARRELLAILPSLPVINMLLNAWAAARGLPAFVTSTVEDVTGTPARSFRQWATDRCRLLLAP